MTAVEVRLATHQKVGLAAGPVAAMLVLLLFHPP